MEIICFVSFHQIYNLSNSICSSSSTNHLESDIGLQNSIYRLLMIPNVYVFNSKPVLYKSKYPSCIHIAYCYRWILYTVTLIFFVHLF